MNDGLLAGQRILIVEDAYLLAKDLADHLQARGARIVGPAGTVARALDLAGREPIDGAVLDVNLRDEDVYPVADLLIARGVPIVFCTGYEELMLRPGYIGLPRCTKPVDKDALAGLLSRVLGGRAPK